MERFREILLDVWREACRHIEIIESTATITQMLVHHMPLEQLLVRRIEPARSCIETVAVGLAGVQDTVAYPRTECTPVQVAHLKAWCERGDIAYRESGPGDRSLPDELALNLPRGVVEKASGEQEHDILVAPLRNLGVLVVIGAPRQVFDPRHRDMVRVLIEPFSAAIENDHRLREMMALREAAEADKRSLLNRLGRKELGDTIVGVDSGLRMVMERVELVARADLPVLIFGETGTGKELVARAIHKRSPRAAGPVIRVNCGAIPPELIDSQLFGHERGAFTGAVESRKGWFERADGGTLFLDEIGELPLAAQVRLLRVLQDGCLDRIGSHRSLNVDVRIVAATHRDLAGMVGEGRFREDLWYRIAVFPIILPPLRERPDDIPLLARHFAGRAAIRFGLAVLMPSDDDMVLLRAYPWPGNVRELATVMDRAAILGDGRRLEVAKALGVTPPVAPAAATPGGAPSSIPPFTGGSRGGLHEPATPNPMSTRAGPDLMARTGSTGAFPTLDDAMRRHIEAALDAAKGRIEGPFGAALLLGINPHTLRARMRKLGIRWSDFRPG